MLIRALRHCTTGEPRVALASASHLAYARGLVHATAGNASLRTEDGFLCTPSGCCLGDVRPQELVAVDRDWCPRANEGMPSSEWRMHAAVFAGVAEANAVLHTHSEAATLLALCLRGVPPLTPEAAHHLGAVECLPAAAPGSAELADAVGAAMERGARAVLLGRHGCVVWGTTARDAFFFAELLEATAKLAWGVQQGGRLL